MTAPEDHSEDAALAGEYALHLLDAEARLTFEKRLAQEPDLRRLLREWEEQLALLAEDVKPVAPPASIKTRVEQRLFAAEKRSGRAVWGWFAGAGLAAAVAVAAVVVILPRVTVPPMAEPSYVAEMAAEDRSLVVVARFAPETATLQIERQAGAAAPGRALELWLIADGAPGPVSLGVLPGDSAANIRVPEDLAAQIAGGTFAITDEPPGGSPTGLPTGAVLAAGAVQEI
ncbi:anti-sigma factor [Leisingera sp. F5]|uniref:anti-sigma factor n=1 Tax=Leisingera sp. F5 TaxID=1813816 RepID=UPI000ABA496C|nr:anti-sigma factor [Leisingera sp. F5]